MAVTKRSSFLSLARGFKDTNFRAKRYVLGTEPITQTSSLGILLLLLLLLLLLFKNRLIQFLKSIKFFAMQMSCKCVTIMIIIVYFSF
jgi:hypothetical protein